MLLVLCEDNPAVTGGFPSQRASDMESVSMSCSHNAASFVIVAILKSTMQSGDYLPIP